MIWIEVFKTGNHTDGQGRSKKWEAADLDKIVDKYDPKAHQAPLVLGHPKHDAPAYGWVAELKREGGKLFAKLTKVSEQLKAWVAEGKYQKRSISLYPDFSLRHVGFLGAQPPAVKGLADFQFNEHYNHNQEETMEFFEENPTAQEVPHPPLEAEEPNPESQENAEESAEKNASTVEELKAIIEAQNIEIEALKVFIQEQGTHEAPSTEGQNEEAEAELSPAERELLAKIEALDSKLQGLEEEKASNFSESQSYFHLKEQEMALDLGVQEGKILPAWKEQGLAEFMACLEEETQSFEFAEGKSKNLKDWFWEFLEGLGKHQLFECYDSKSRHMPLSKEEEAKKLGQEIAKTTGFVKG